mmetsp:Transcript_11511/g.14933  ORF Transcript_11511/g.14933 Transcript_11511/m.14933 type:complete len:305 (+) Transcript_11511:262-1176(+)
MKKNLYFLADLHALTARQDPQKLSENIYDMTASLLACGIDHRKSALFQQSCVSGHSELTWVLMCQATMGQLNRMTQFKTKSDKEGGQTAANAGLFTYPVLMAADILLYKATEIPVGDDQLQHLELARDLAERFNHVHKCSVLKMPTPLMSDSAATRVMSLQDGKKKMSKSDRSEKSRILLTDSADAIRKKIKSAPTDSFGVLDDSVISNPERFNLRNLLELYSSFTNQSPEQAVASLSGSDMASFKNLLVGALVEKICPIGDEIARLKKDKAFLDSVLNEGSKYAESLSQQTILEVKQTVGLLR